MLTRLLLALCLVPAPAADDVAPAAPGIDAARVEAMLAEVVEEVEEIRGLEFLRDVPVRVIVGAEVRRHAEQRLADLDARETLELGRRAWVRMGLIAEDFDLLVGYLDLMQEQAGGYYDPASGAFFVLESIPQALVPVVMAHELTHAVEDQHYDLDRRLRENLGDDDRLFADGAVHEGSATLVMMLALARRVLRGQAAAAALQSIGLFDPGRQAIDAFPPALLRQIAAPYMVGAAFLARGSPLTVLSRGLPVADIDRVYADPPRSSEQILHPEKYWGPGPRDEPRPASLGAAGRALGRRWRPVHRGVLGELNLAALVGAGVPLDDDPLGAISGGAWTDEAAAGWGGDRWELWSDGKRDAVLLGTIWDDETEAREFAGALSGDRRCRRSRRGNAVALVFGVEGRRARRVLDRMLDALADGSR